MRKIAISFGEYYHIYNRGNNKQTIFLEEKDWIRFLFLVVYFQSPLFFENLNRQVAYFVRNRAFNIDEREKKKIESRRYVELVNFAFMSNHFHLTLRESKEGGTAAYMQRVLCGYTKYFNAKYKKSGHLFQGPYKAVHVGSNDQLLYLSTYIHRNPRELNRWKNKEEQYPWSSLSDYIGRNRWGALLKNDVVLSQFKDTNEYRKFVRTSVAKTTEELDKNMLIDLDKS